MSNISDAYDAIRTALSTVYSAKTEIPNPYSLPDNVEGFLRDGYGLIYSGGVPAEQEFNTRAKENTFTVILTRELLTVDSDVEPRHTVAKLLLEDVNTFDEKFGDNSVLSLPDDIDHILLAPSTGITEFLVGKNHFLSIEVSMLVRITEEIPC